MTPEESQIIRDVFTRIRSAGPIPNDPQARSAISQELIANPDGTSRPIDLGPPGEVVVLRLYGTGIRNRSSLSAVTMTIGGMSAEVQYAGAQTDFVGFDGLDQINVRVPRSLIGRGEVDLVLRVDGKTANTVRVNIK